MGDVLRLEGMIKDLSDKLDDVREYTYKTKETVIRLDEGYKVIERQAAAAQKAADDVFDSLESHKRREGIIAAILAPLAAGVGWLAAHIGVTLKR